MEQYRVMRLFVLSHGWLAIFTNSIDIAYWESYVLPLAFHADVPAAYAVARIQAVNPDNHVIFAGGLHEFMAFTAKGPS